MAGFDHHGHEQSRESRSIGHGRAGQSRENAGGQNGHIPEAALHVAHQRQGNVHDALGQAARVHDLAGQHEERHRQEWEAVGAVDDVLCDDLGVEQIHVVHQGDAADEQGVGDRHSDRHGAEKRADEDRDGHDCTFPGVGAGVASPLSRRSRSANSCWSASSSPCSSELLDHDKLLIRQLATDRAVEIGDQDQAGRDAEDDADAIEPAGREAGGRRCHIPVDHGLLPTALEQQPGGVEHEDLSDDQAGALARIRQASDQGIDTEMAMLAQGHDGAQEGQPDEEPARDLFRDRNAGVEGVTQHHVAENENDHDRQEQGNQDL